MSGGGGSAPRVQQTAPAPTAQDPAVEAAKADIRRRRQRTFSRRDTRVSLPAQASRDDVSVLKGTLG
jgi:hypothetical protein